MGETRRIKTKVCLVGEHAVGKTSLIRRFVLDQFDDAYLVTLGAKVSKKEMDLDLLDMDVNVHMDMMIWDIMGAKGFRELLREAYFHGAQGVMAVCDLSRHETLEELDSWIETVFRTVGEIPVILAVNKNDLTERAFDEAEVKSAAEAFDCSYFLTSAKTGENVEKAFRDLGRSMVLQRVKA